ncbi:MAG: cytochrome P460 family protein [Bacteroidales bacterium]|nr:cytochrome P460 family protein [Bacteroidales bacterium]MCF8405923.1 cytochrome P460 family protein [Bacteroidales bacterium]
MTKQLRLFALMAFAGILVFSACKKDEADDPNDQPADEFVATDNSFTNFRTWALEAQAQGPDPALGPAHAGNDSTVVRSIYFKDGQDRVNGEYPVGTIIVKEGLNTDNTFQEITALVKRGNDFNSSAGDWEWFMLQADGSIAVDGEGNPIRGANLLNGMCVSCHTAASDRDYVFSKQ